MTLHLFIQWYLETSGTDWLGIRLYNLLHFFVYRCNDRYLLHVLRKWCDTQVFLSYRISIWVMTSQHLHPNISIHYLFPSFYLVRRLRRIWEHILWWAIWSLLNWFEPSILWLPVDSSNIFSSAAYCLIVYDYSILQNFFWLDLSVSIYWVCLLDRPISLQYLVPCHLS